MKCEEAKATMIPFIEGEVGKEESLQLEKHYQECPQCQREWLTVKKMMEELVRLPVPEPSESMEKDFYRMLEGYKHVVKNEEKKWYELWWESIDFYLNRPLVAKIAYALLFLLIGWGIGNIQHADKASDEKLLVMSEEINEMKKMMMLSLLEKSSASERMRAVNLTDQIPSADDKIIEALVETLNNDPNVNVRLVTVNALLKYASHPTVRSELVKSLVTQDSPVVQLELVNAIMHLQEKKAVPMLEQMLQDKGLNESVREKVTLGLQVLS